MTTTPNDTGVEYGIWTAGDGGFVETGCWGRDNAEERLADYVTEDSENKDDLSVVRVCETHPEQPAEGCDRCYDSDEDDWYGDGET